MSKSPAIPFTQIIAAIAAMAQGYYVKEQPKVSNRWTPPAPEALQEKIEGFVKLPGNYNIAKTKVSLTV